MIRPSLETGVSIKRQQKILNAIHENPLGSYVFSGPPGVGKTTLLRELERLARIAQPRNFAVYAKPATQFQRDVTARSKGERVMVPQSSCFNQDAKWQMRWALYLDDVDKVSGSEFIRRELFDLLNAATDQREPNTVVAMTTNMNKLEFAKFFGDAIAWRVAKHCLWVPMERGADGDV